MARETRSRRTIVRVGAYGLVGLVGTAVITLALLLAGQPLQAVLFDALYLQVGPWTAEESAIVLIFTLAGTIGIGVPTLATVYHRGGRPVTRRVGVVLVVAIAILAVGLLVGAIAGVMSWLAAIVGTGAFLLGVPLGIRSVDAWPHGVAALVGGTPVLVVLLLLLGVGLGWGGGYDVVATELPANTTQSVDADLSTVPEFRDDLLTPDASGTFGYCETVDGLRTCHLPLRGYDREAHAVRFLADHGVRCAYRNAPSSGHSSMLARDGDTVYRIRCITYGD